MLTFSSKRLATILALLAARQPAVSCFSVLPPPRHAAFHTTTTRALFASTSPTDNQEVASMRAGEIKKELESYGISTKSFLEKSELVDALTKARADGLKPKETTTTTTSTSSDASPKDSVSREAQIKEELVKCQAMKASELKQELQALGVSTRSFFEKSEFAQALAEARVDGVTKQQTSGEGYAEYDNVEVLTDDSSGPRQKQSQQQQQQPSPFGGAGSPFGGGGGTPGANPFGDMGGMGGMGGIADMLKNMGAGGASPGGAANPFGGGGANPFAGGANPFGGGAGGMGDMMGKAQEMMKNPKIREIIAKAQSNPKIMKAVQECMSNPAAMAKYKDDPEVASLLSELQKYM